MAKATKAKTHKPLGGKTLSWAWDPEHDVPLIWAERRSICGGKWLLRLDGFFFLFCTPPFSLPSTPPILLIPDQ
jgi:hypothetical protein